ncbi:hypothetical protein SNE510_67980 [Streptomyces sp. NE5-10]|nr:hypothetical protein SNE510_67980 [Streptomyces sp. NE5-10]
MTGTTTGVGRAEPGRGGPVIAGQGLGRMRLEDATSDRAVRRALDPGVTAAEPRRARRPPRRRPPVRGVPGRPRDRGRRAALRLSAGDLALLDPREEPA